MTTRPHPLFADASEAARLMGMKRAEFLRHVESGALPGPCRFDRWDVEVLRAVMRGEALARNEDLEI